MAKVLVTGARAPVALHLARLMAGAGHQVLMADSQPCPMAAASRAHRGFHLLPSPRFRPDGFGAALAGLIRREGVDLVLPTCEEVFYLAQLWQGDRPPARLFAPSLPLLAEVHDKHRFIGTCARLGLAVPRTRLLTSPADLAALRAEAGDLVFKPVWSRFAAQVLIRPEARALDRIIPSKAAPWVAQDHLAGQEISTYAVAVDGRLVALSAYRGIYRAGKGAAVAFAPLVDDAVSRFVARFVEGTGWTGQISFDLMRLPDGRVLPLECNPRATSGLHFFRNPGRFSAALLMGSEVAPDVTRPQGVRLALWLYGLPAAIGAGRIDPFRRALRQVQEVLDWPGDPGPKQAQWAALRGIAARALRERISLQQATTRDIEWNGPDQSSI